MLDSMLLFVQRPCLSLMDNRLTGKFPGTTNPRPIFLRTGTGHAASGASCRCP